MLMPNWDCKRPILSLKLEDKISINIITYLSNKKSKKLIHIFAPEIAKDLKSFVTTPTFDILEILVKTNVMNFFTGNLLIISH